MGHAHASPTTMDGQENIGEFADKGGLLFGSEHEIAVAEMFGSESSEDPAADAEIGLTHVGAFFSAFEAKSNAAKVVAVHGAVRQTNTISCGPEKGSIEI